MSYGPTNRELAFFMCLVAVLGYVMLRAGEVFVWWVIAHLAWN